MADTIREQIIKAILAQLALIRTAGGYNTDIGVKVRRAAIEIPVEDMPVTNMFPFTETSRRDTYGKQSCDMLVQVRVYQVYGEDNPNEVGEPVLGDVVKCMGGLARTLPDDVEYTGGGIPEYPGPEDKSFETVVEFRIKYRTLIGNPYAQ